MYLIMILFAKDWITYPTAIIHTNTRNKSFVRLAMLYKAMGVDNHCFLLALINRDLEFIDPHSTDLTIEQKAAIIVECAINPWYYLREVAMAPGRGSSDSTLIEANRGIIALVWCFFNHIMTILIQPRQTGKTFGSHLLLNLLARIICKNTQINILTKDDTLRRETITSIKDIGSCLPWYLQRVNKSDTDNGENVTINSLGNKILTHLPQSSPKRAYNAGRGLTSPIFVVDEGPFQPNIRIALGSALGASGAAVDAAKENGTPYGTILTTTAGRKDDADGAYVYKLLQDAAEWTEMFFDCNDAEELETIVRRNSHSTEEGRGGVFRINITLNHRQLGKSDEWLKEKLDASTQTGEDANRDYFNIWTSGNSLNPIPIWLLEKIAASETDILHTHISKPGGYVTKWYIPENEIEYRMASSKVALGIDTSDASGGDDIGFIMTDIETLEVICTGSYNETNLIVFAMWLCSVLVQFKNVTAIIERKSTGSTIIDYLLLMLPEAGEDPFKRLFNRVVQEADESPDRYKEIMQPMNRRSNDIYIRFKKMFGFATAGAGYASRTELYSTTLMNAIKRSADKIRDKKLINQIKGLESKNGRVDHRPGEHDDSVISWLLCHWFVSEGKRLSFYGIDASKIMSNITVHTDSNDSSSNYKEPISQFQKDLREKINYLYNRLSDEKDIYVCIRLEQELRSLDRQLILEDGDIFSVNSLIENAKQNKRTKLTNRNINNYNTNIDINPNTNYSGMSDRPLSANELLGNRY